MKTHLTLALDGQVSIVRNFVRRLTEGCCDQKTNQLSIKSMVHQMIMGGGKTAVVSPLLAMMIADGHTFVMEVVPAQLIAMNRNVMWESFSQFVRKPCARRRPVIRARIPM